MPSSLRVRVVLVAALLSPSPAHAAPDEAPTAEALFRQGRQAAERGDWASACGHFAESQRLDPAPGTSLNLALCEEKLGRLSAAWAHAHEATDRLAAADPRAAVAAELAARLDRRVARLRITLDPAAPGASVVRDGTSLGRSSLGLALPVDPGEHLVEVSAPGRAPASYRVTLAEGQERELRVAPGAPSPGAPSSTPAASIALAPAAPTPVAGSAGRAPAWAWVALGVGAAGLATSAVTGAMVLSRKHTVDDGCTPDRACTPGALDAAEQGRTLSTVSTVSFVVGVAGVGAGVALLVWGRGGQGVSLRPAPGGLAAGYQGSFSLF